MTPLLLGGVFDSLGEENNITVNSKKVNVYFKSEDKVREVLLEEYIIGVLCAEMPASFDAEALKAQAVAARTYTINKIKNNINAPEHIGGDICTDFAHCQAYISEKDARKNWGKNADEYYKKCKDAVFKTSGEVMIYDDEPVKAVFHSSSSGMTENAKDVWGGDVPYLVSVESPGEELCPSHKSEVVKSIKEFKTILSKEQKLDYKKKIFGNIERSNAGAVKSIEIFGEKFKGTKIRSLFGLRSACFNVIQSGDNVIFKVTGNGHGVGMSQYGANYMASEGSKYEEILKTYYKGVEIVKIDE